MRAYRGHGTFLAEIYRAFANATDLQKVAAQYQRCRGLWVAAECKACGGLLHAGVLLVVDKKCNHGGHSHNWAGRKYTVQTASISSPQVRSLPNFDS
eukprot:g71983.t1